MTEKLTIELWKRVSRVLDELLELDRDRQRDLLLRLRAEDPKLFWWTRTLLEAAITAGDFMERSAVPGVRELCIKILAAAGPPSPASACSQWEGPLEAVERGGSHRDGPGRDEP